MKTMRSHGVIESLENRVLLSVAMGADGWTVITPSASAHQIYVSSTSGADTNNGLAPVDDPAHPGVGPVASLAKGYALIRNVSDDEMLLKRGDIFVGNLSGWGKSGLNPQEPIVLTNYGDPNAARPVIDSGVGSAISGSSYVVHLAIVGIDFTSSTHDPTSPNYNGRGSYGLYDLGTLDDLLIEDCRFRNFVNGITLQATSMYGPISNVTIRRSEIIDAYNTNGNSQGLYSYGVNGLTLEENIFDHDGWSENVPGAPANIYSHDAYVASNNTNCVIKGNLFADSANSGLQARGGGIVDDNLFVSDPTSLSFGLTNGATVTVGGVSGEVIGNVFLKSRALAPSSPGGIGAQLGNLKPGGGTEMANNIFEDDTQGINPAMQFAPGNAVANPQDEVGLNTLVVENNIVHNWGFGVSFSGDYQPGVPGSTDLNQVVIRNNDFQNNLTGRIVSHGYIYDPRYESWSGNRYASPTDAADWFALQGAHITLAQWQKQVEPTAIAATVPYVDPTRTLETYMAWQGLPATASAWITGARALNKSNWDPRYLSTAVISYIQAGYEVDANPPVAALAPPANVTPGNYKATPAVSFAVNYSDAVAVDPATLASGNLTVAGPGGVSLPVALTGATGSGSSITAAYTASPPTGGWAAVPFGTYVISLVSGQVKNTGGVATAAQSLGSFQVTVNADPQPPKAPAATPASFVAHAGASAITLSWTDAAADARGFVLQRALDPGFAVGLQSFPLTGGAGNYVDGGVNVGTNYYYQLIATNPIGNSAPTAAALATVLPAAPALSSVTLNDGNTQRASIFSATLVFTQKVAMDATKVQLLVNKNGGSSVSPDVLAVANPSGDGRIWVVTWSSGQPGDELADGSYSLVVHGALITDAYGQSAGADKTTTFTVANPPVVANVVWTHSAPPHTLAFTFNQDVSATLSLSSLKLLNGSSQVVPAASYSWNAATLTATYTFVGALPDNSYRAQISAATTTNAAGVHLDGNGDGIPGDDYIFNFYLGKPSLSVAGLPYANVGGIYTLTLSKPYDSSGTPISYLIHWGDAVTTSSPTVGAFQHTYASPLNETPISIDVVDANGTHTNCASLTVLVSRASIALTGAANGGTGAAANVNPNGTYTLHLGAVTDPGFVVSQYIIHWGDGTTTAATDPAQPLTHVYANSKYYALNDTIAVDLVDNSGPIDGSGNPTLFTNVSAGTLSVTVNSWPYVETLGALNANVSGVFHLVVSAPYDPGFTPSQMTVHWGDGSAPQVILPAATVLTHTYATAGPQVITVDVTDPSGVYATASLETLTVNPPPTVALSGNATSSAGSIYAMNIAPANDIGQTVNGYTVHWGDGASDSYAVPGSATHTYASVGKDTIAVDVTDGTGVYSAAGTLAVTVNNNPTIVLSGSGNANVGGAYTLNLGAVHDPGHTVTSATVHWGDGTSNSYPPSGAVTHVFPTTGSDTITVDLTDSNGTYANVATMPVVVNRPSVSLNGGGTVYQGQTYTLSLGPAYDVGGSPTQYVVHWGDGTSSTLTQLGSVTHMYAAALNAIITTDLIDATGTFRNAGSMPLKILPAPTISVSGAAAATENVPYTLNLGAVTDPAGAVTGYTVHWGDGTSNVYTAGGPVTHLYTATSVGEPITVDLTDPLGTYDNAGGSLMVSVGGASVIGRYVYYNNSTFDANNPTAATTDFRAIARTKQALLPGQTASFANYTSYTKGINGILIDVVGLPAGTNLSAADFSFHTGLGGNPTGWSVAPAPASVTILRGAGDNGSDVIDLTWPDSSIVGKWLQIKVLADANTGLTTPDVFYFGNAPGDTGNSTTDAQVTAADVLLIRKNLSILPVSVNSPYDFNRDGRITIADALIARSHQTNASTALQLMTAPTSPTSMNALARSASPHKATTKGHPAGAVL
ncbi:MAG TPA: hypothetical protein VFC78_19585 [Tepidisphaeraceae bacterium]|nr:hypothetical protein [Tepidisphaeraceae bacterium]